MRILNASHNQITTIPPALFSKTMRSLTHLLLANNGLRTLPESVSELGESLLYLDLEENGFVYLPHSLSLLSTLRSLKLTSSKMTVVPHSLPPSLRSLSLVRMDIDEDSEVFFLPLWMKYVFDSSRWWCVLVLCVCPTGCLSFSSDHSRRPSLSASRFSSEIMSASPHHSGFLITLTPHYITNPSFITNISFLFHLHHAT